MRLKKRRKKLKTIWSVGHEIHSQKKTVQLKRTHGNMAIVTFECLNEWE